MTSVVNPTVVNVETEYKNYVCDNCREVLKSNSGDPREEVYYLFPNQIEAVPKKICKKCEEE